MFLEEADPLVEAGDDRVSDEEVLKTGRAVAIERRARLEAPITEELDRRGTARSAQVHRVGLLNPFDDSSDPDLADAGLARLRRVSRLQCRQASDRRSGDRNKPAATHLLCHSRTSRPR